LTGTKPSVRDAGHGFKHRRSIRPCPRNRLLFSASPTPASPHEKPVTQYFLRGLVAFLPLALTVYVLYLFITWTESIAIALIRPFIGDFYLPGLGIVIGAALIFGLGVLISQPYIARLLSLLELPFTNLPVIKSIYSSLKNFADYFAPHDKADQQQVVLLRMPGNELSIVGLVTRQSFADLPGGAGRTRPGGRVLAHGLHDRRLHRVRAPQLDHAHRHVGRRGHAFVADRVDVVQPARALMH